MSSINFIQKCTIMELFFDTGLLSTSSVCELVNQICASFFKKTGITHFEFARLYNDGRRIALCNNASWIDFFIKEKNNHNLIIENSKISLHPKYLLWRASTDIYQSSIFQIARESFNIDNGFTMAEYSSTYCDLYYFSSTRDNYNIQNFYLNNIDLLNLFILYFKDRAAKLMFIANNNLKNQNNSQKINDINLTFLPNKLDVEKIFLSGFYQGDYLTKREAECLAYLLHGKTAKEIAKIFNISYRTIESYIRNIKVKLNSTTKDQLIKQAFSAHFKSTAETIINLYNDN